VKENWDESQLDMILQKEQYLKNLERTKMNVVLSNGMQLEKE
jgi:hypothetical protein